MPAAKTSLSYSYPRRYEVPLLIIASGILLWIGLSQPLFEVEKGVL